MNDQVVTAVRSCGSRYSPALFGSSGERPSKATLALAPCCWVEMDLGTEVGVVDVCRVGVETPFFSGWQCALACKVNSRWVLNEGQ